MYCKELISKLNASRGFVSELCIQWESGIVKFGIRNTTVPKETFLEGTREQLWTVMLKRRPCRLQTVQTECYFFLVP